jgi:hypothetical protein
MFFYCLNYLKLFVLNIYKMTEIATCCSFHWWFVKLKISNESKMSTLLFYKLENNSFMLFYQIDTLLTFRRNENRYICNLISPTLTLHVCVSLMKYASCKQFQTCVCVCVCVCVCTISKLRSSNIFGLFKSQN